jgi:hypothetical protein
LLSGELAATIPIHSALEAAAAVLPFIISIIIIIFQPEAAFLDFLVASPPLTLTST